MAIHPKDKTANNPRLQCSVCKRWMRLHGKRLEVVDGKVAEVAVQRFFGGCSFTRGDHLAGDKMDVCDGCCQTECKAMAASCQRWVGSDGGMVCDRCGSMWSPLLHATGWLPMSCPDRHAHAPSAGASSPRRP